VNKAGCFGWLSTDRAAAIRLMLGDWDIASYGDIWVRYTFNSAKAFSQIQGPKPAVKLTIRIRNGNLIPDDNISHRKVNRQNVLKRPQYLTFLRRYSLNIWCSNNEFLTDNFERLLTFLNNQLQTNRMHAKQSAEKYQNNLLSSLEHI